MKKLFIFFLPISFFLSSCSVEEDCSCGYVTNDRTFIENGTIRYTLEVQNDCSGNLRTFNVDYNSWFQNSIDDYVCMGNFGAYGQNWMIVPSYWQEIPNQNKSISIDVKQNQ